MKKQYIAFVIFILAAIIVVFLAVFLCGLIQLNNSPPTPTTTPTATPKPTQTQTSNPTSPPTPTPSTATPAVYTYTIINTFPHDISAFTEGLVYDNGYFFESSGGFGSSSLRQVNIESGTVQQQITLPGQYFGEGLTVVNNTLVQLTWQNKIGFVYDKDTLGLIGNFSYSTKGWGLTYDGNRLIMSDGTSNLYFIDPTTHQRIGSINVHEGANNISNINELEYINGDIYANIWMQQKIAIINPETGQVKGWIDLTGIYNSEDPNAVLNGIAYDQQNDRLFVTGKDWPNLYEIKITLAS